MRVAKTKALISFAVTAKLICVFVFAYAKSRFSYDAAHILMSILGLIFFQSLLMIVKVSLDRYCHTWECQTAFVTSEYKCKK